MAVDTTNAFNNYATTAVTDASSTATSRGTKIVKQGNDMDKNAFLRILTTEMSNQNPDNPADSTQYVAQLAQFSSLEQMTNLNNTMTLSGAASLIGKTVVLKSVDENGNFISGTVKSVTKNGDNVNLNIDVTENGKTESKDFAYSDIYQISSNS
ncbi:MAG: flagellar hook capping FlgD N-terminal domain-containing protein [Bacillota bacterium]|nr:flagellar hook capping FlgD N-terminal domain-containing protein [Bacillota bacterium]